MQTILVQLGNAGIPKNQVCQGDFLFINSMSGTTLKVTAVAKDGTGTETVLMVAKNMIRFDAQYSNLQISSDVDNDIITLTYGKGYVWPFGEMIVFMKSALGGFINLFSADGQNLAAAPSVLSGAGSSTGGFLTQLPVQGFNWISIAISTYVSGQSGTPLLYSPGNLVGVPADMIDAATGSRVDVISSPNTWYKIKVQGGDRLDIPFGSLVGSGSPGSAINFALEKGYTDWEYINPAYTVVAKGLSFNSNAQQKYTIDKPINAKGVIFWLDGTFDPGAAFTFSLEEFNPLTGTPTGSPTAIMAAGAVQKSVAYTPYGGTIPGGLTAVIAGALGYSSTAILQDNNATGGTPDTNVSLVAEWIY